MLTRAEAHKITENVLKFSTLPECQVSLVQAERAYTRFANNGITTAAFNLTHQVSIQVARDGRTGTATVNDLEEASLRAAVRRAEELAALSPPDPEAMPPLGPQEFPATLGFDERTAEARSPQMIPHVKTVIDAAKARSLVAAGLIERTHSVRAVANKAGLFGFHNSADAGITTTVRMADGSSSGWAGHPSTRLSEIDSAAMAKRAIDKCLTWRNPKRLEPGKYEVVLEATATGDLIRLMGGGFSARATEEGRTFLSKRGGGTLLGEKLFPDFITLRSDPFDPRLPSSPWTGELLPARAMSWIDKGRVANLSYDRYWAEKSKQQPTGQPGNVILDGGTAPLSELIADVKRGLLVTHFWYIRSVNPQTLQFTGLTRDGLFLIENGRITTPVVNLRFNESPVNLLKNAVNLAPAIRVRGLEGGISIAPAVHARDFAFTSVSDAI